MMEYGCRRRLSLSKQCGEHHDPRGWMIRSQGKEFSEIYISPILTVLCTRISGSSEHDAIRWT